MREYLKDYTLLYAEDQKEVQMGMMEYFETYFKKVYVASDGQEALDLYKQHKPDVLLLDILMPKIQGLELARIVRQDDDYTRIIMLTAHKDENLLFEAIEIDMSKYLVKPSSSKEIKETLDKVARELVTLSSDIVKFTEDLYYLKSSKKLIKEHSNEIELSQKEGRLLELLIEKANTPISVEDIIAVVWEENFNEEISKDSVKSQVSYLRKKLPSNSIQSVYGIGYMLKI